MEQGGACAKGGAGGSTASPSAEASALVGHEGHEGLNSKRGVWTQTKGHQVAIKESGRMMGSRTALSD